MMYVHDSPLSFMAKHDSTFFSFCLSLNDVNSDFFNQIVFIKSYVTKLTVVKYNVLIIIMKICELIVL